MEETIKNFLKKGNLSKKYGFILLSQLKSNNYSLKTIPSEMAHQTKMVFYDSPKFDFFKKNIFIYGNNCNKRTFYYLISKNVRTPLNKDKNLFNEIFPFLEIRATSRKAAILSKNISLSAVLHSKVFFVNPLSKKETLFQDFLECEFSGSNEIEQPFLDFQQFFIENFWQKFRELQIPLVLNEDKLNLKIEKDEPVGSALLKTIRKQLFKIEGFRYGVISDIHPEYVHEMRVAFRKTRSYLNTFPEVFGIKRAKSLSISASSFSYDLGLLRDLDVFQDHLKDFLKEIDSRGKEDEILNFFQNKRKEEFEIVQRVFNSAKFDKFLLRFFNFSATKTKFNIFEKKPFSKSAFEKLSLLKSTIRKRMKKYKKSGSLDMLHRVRISFKKFRYLFEILEPFYGKQREKLKEKLSEIQDCLGFLQDLQVAQNFIEEATREKEDKDIIIVCGSLFQLIKQKEKKELKKFAKIYNEFTKIGIPIVDGGGQDENSGSGSRKSWKRNSKGSSF